MGSGFKKEQNGRGFLTKYVLHSTELPTPPNTALTSDWVFNEFRLYLFVNTLKALKEVYDP